MTLKINHLSSNVTGDTFDHFSFTSAEFGQEAQEIVGWLIANCPSRQIKITENARIEMDLFTDATVRPKRNGKVVDGYHVYFKLDANDSMMFGVMFGHLL